MNVFDVFDKYYFCDVDKDSDCSKARDAVFNLIVEAQRAQKALPVLRNMLRNAGLAGADIADEHNDALLAALARIEDIK